jgi:hypothetical protein
MVFDEPVFHRSDFGGDHRLLIGFKNLLLLSGDRDVELNAGPLVPPNSSEK